MRNLDPEDIIEAALREALRENKEIKWFDTLETDEVLPAGEYQAAYVGSRVTQTDTCLSIWRVYKPIR